MPNVNDAPVPLPPPRPHPIRDKFSGMLHAGKQAADTVVHGLEKVAAPVEHKLESTVSFAAHKTRELVGKVDFPNGGNPLANIDSPAVFSNGNAATGAQIDAVLKHYGSPYAGKGEVIAKAGREKGINPILLLAVMQKESSYGNKNNMHSLKPENIANPFSVHFTPDAVKQGGQPIDMLRINGRLSTFEESLNGAIDTLKKLAGNSATPLTTAGQDYSEVKGAWTKDVKAFYKTQLDRISKM